MSTTETKTPVTEFPGLERNAQRLFAQPYAELPVRFQAAVRKVTKQDAAEALLETLTSGFELIQSAFAHVSHGGPTRAEAEEWLSDAAAVIRKSEGRS